MPDRMQTSCWDGAVMAFVRSVLPLGINMRLSRRTLGCGTLGRGALWNVQAAVPRPRNAAG